MPDSERNKDLPVSDSAGPPPARQGKWRSDSPDHLASSLQNRRISRRGVLKGGLLASVAAVLASIGIIKPQPAQAVDYYYYWICWNGTWHLLVEACVWEDICGEWVEICWADSWTDTGWGC